MSENVIEKIPPSGVVRARVRGPDRIWCWHESGSRLIRPEGEVCEPC